MKKALIQGTRIAQIVNPGEDFPVSPSLRWVDVDDATTERDTFENDVVVKEQPKVARRPRYEAAIRALIAKGLLTELEIEAQQ